MVLGLFASGAAAQAAPSVLPIAACLRDLGPNATPRYEAHFRYQNTTSSTINTPIGDDGSGNINTVTGGGAPTKQETEFLPGLSDAWPNTATVVPFDGTGTVRWTLGQAGETSAFADINIDTPLCSYLILVDKVWTDSAGNGSPIPPPDLTPLWRLDMTAFDSAGNPTGASGNCVYLLPDPTLRCTYINPPSSITDRLVVPENGSYQVLETPDLSPNWVPADPSGLGTFNPVTVYCETPHNNIAADCYHLARTSCRAGRSARTGRRPRCSSVAA
jgi:hypothetical protein